MHRTIHILLHFLLFFGIVSISLQAQDSAFILVDISGSGPSTGDNRTAIRDNAREIARDIVMARYNATKYDANWKWSSVTDTRLKKIKEGQGKPLITTSNRNCYVMIMPFGERLTYTNFKIEKMDNINQFDPFFSRHYPKRFRDRYTYNDIARAKAAGVAKSPQVNIGSYYLIVISDDLKDTNSKAPKFTAEEQSLLDDYGTATTREEKLATIRYQGEVNNNYNIVISKVNVAKLQIPITPIDTLNVDRKKLTLITPKGTSKKPTEIDITKPLSVSWQCLGCGDSIDFMVKVANLDNKKVKQNRRTRRLNEKFQLEEAGKYKISVRAGNMTKTAYVQVERGGLGDLFVLLLLLAAIIGGIYYFLNQRKERELEEDSHSESTEWSPTSPGTTPIEPPAGDYF